MFSINNKKIESQVDEETKEKMAIIVKAFKKKRHLEQDKAKIQFEIDELESLIKDVMEKNLQTTYEKIRTLTKGVV